MLRAQPGRSKLAWCQDVGAFAIDRKSLVQFNESLSADLPIADLASRQRTSAHPLPVPVPWIQLNVAAHGHSSTIGSSHK